MIPIEISRYKEVKNTLMVYALNQSGFIVILYLYSLLNVGLPVISVLMLLTLVANYFFITAPFIRDLRRVEVENYCLYNESLNVIEIKTKRWEGYITPEHYLVLLVHKVGKSYYVYEGSYGMVVPSKCIILTEKGYETWRGLYKNLLEEEDIYKGVGIETYL